MRNIKRAGAGLTNLMLEHANRRQGRTIGTPALSKAGIVKIGIATAFLLFLAFVIALWPSCEKEGHYYNTSTVKGNSMAPTIREGDRIKVRFREFNVQRYDIVTFELTIGEKPQRFFKRVAGIPGDTVQYGDQPQVTLDRHQYWLLGDNPAISFDSRHFGPVHHRHISGVVTEIIKKE